MIKLSPIISVLGCSIVCFCFLSSNSVAFAEQRILFKAERFEYQAANPAGECEDKCAAESWNIESFLSSGWKIVSVIPNQQKIVERWDDGGSVTLPGVTSASQGHNIYLSPKGCTCIGNSYVLEKDNS